MIVTTNTKLVVFNISKLLKYPIISLIFQKVLKRNERIMQGYWRVMQQK